MAFLSLREYGLIGNQESGALVSRLGSIDWCCLPHMDSSSHFAHLLDDNQGGIFQICPKGDFTSEQTYIEGTNVLQTHFETPAGKGILTDWMPIEDYSRRDPVIHRKIEMVEGVIQWVMTCTPRFGYGAERAQAEKSRGGVLFRGSAPTDIALLTGTVPITIASEGRTASSLFEMKEKKCAEFSWLFGREKLKALTSPEQTVKFWKSWTHRCNAHLKHGVPGYGPQVHGAISTGLKTSVSPTQATGEPASPSPESRAETTCLFAGPWHDSVIRSSLVIKLMTSYFSGSIAESLTTSLPSLKGGSRNWDFRYAWLRESAFSIQALHQLGHHDEAEALFHWLSDTVTRDGADGLQSVYTLDGGKYLPERDLTFLSGYAGARPVRVGNIAARQFQLDTYGHVVLAAFQRFERFGKLPDGLWPKISEIAEYVAQAWRRPDRGPWEVRSKPEHFVTSKVMCWVALDRCIRIAEAMNQPVPNRWREEAAIVHRTICEQGYDQTQHSFVRAFGERDLDASVLLIPMVGFLPPDDDRVQTTLDALQGQLSEGALVHRYRGQDGLPEADGAHLLSSFWFVSCLALCGRTQEASDRLAELCSYASSLGLLGEQVDPSTGEPSGNFPSTSAHFALINAGIYVGIARGRKPVSGTLIGVPVVKPTSTSAAKPAKVAPKKTA
ncbi:MAG: glycoside hydrolase family 15 protein [Methylotenera sp.]|nr:glycoside hydrolase family 15 protein [Oligoflexia bacterium]